MQLWNVELHCRRQDVPLAQEMDEFEFAGAGAQHIAPPHICVFPVPQVQVPPLQVGVPPLQAAPVLNVPVVVQVCGALLLQLTAFPATPTQETEALSVLHTYVPQLLQAALGEPARVPQPPQAFGAGHAQVPALLQASGEVQSLFVQQ